MFLARCPLAIQALFETMFTWFLTLLVAASVFLTKEIG
mgnify:FL=1